MRRLVGLGSLAVALMLPLGSAGAQTQVIGFEGLGAGAVPVGYAGLTWSAGPFSFWNIALSGSSLFRGSTGNASAYSEETATLSFSRPGEAFDFNSIFLSEVLSGPPDRTDINTTIWGFRDGELVYETSIPLDHFDMVKYDLNWTNVDKVTIGAIKGRIIVDDITLTSTPEPATMLLVGSGLAGVFGAARRRKNAQAAQA
ncbi:MAG TPA: PEP-CTERM sorting domain-containing protein [Gemmatimonadaceae bacterium]